LSLNYKKHGFGIRDPGSTKHRIPDPDQQHWFCNIKFLWDSMERPRFLPTSKTAYIKKIRNLSVSDDAQRLRLVEVRYLAELPPRHSLIKPLAGNGAQGRMADGRRRGAAGGGGQGGGRETVPAALWNPNYFLRFRFRLLKSSGSGSGSNF
jgi:hypothetical protein